MAYSHRPYQGTRQPAETTPETEGQRVKRGAQPNGPFGSSQEAMTSCGAQSWACSPDGTNRNDRDDVSWLMKNLQERRDLTAAAPRSVELDVGLLGSKGLL